MNTYLIEPKAPLIVRSGRPFDGQTGADEACFPPPSTLAGALRTAHAESNLKTLGVDLAEISVAGPLPVKIDASGKRLSLLVPRPADALYFRKTHKSEVQLVQAVPRPLADGEGCDLPHGLLPVQLATDVQVKPAPGPRWWAWEDLIAFRRPGTTSSPQLVYADVAARGWTPPPEEVRTHVAIERKTQAAEAGKLFQTAGLGFWQRTEKGAAFPAGGIGILGRIDGKIAAGVITVGGERRLSAIAATDDALWPRLPETLVGEIRNAGGLSITLLTPALFAEGWRPAWLDENLEGTPPGCDGLRIKLRAAAVPRWQPHSGWDLAKGQPRAGRKIAPAGAVFWFDIVEIGDVPLAALWLAPISDQEQDRRDGFGLALPQPWFPV